MGSLWWQVSSSSETRLLYAMDTSEFIADGFTDVITILNKRMIASEDFSSLDLVGLSSAMGQGQAKLT